MQRFPFRFPSNGKRLSHELPHSTVYIDYRCKMYSLDVIIYILSLRKVIIFGVKLVFKTIILYISWRFNLIFRGVIFRDGLCMPNPMSERGMTIMGRSPYFSIATRKCIRQLISVCPINDNSRLHSSSYPISMQNIFV